MNKKCGQCVRRTTILMNMVFKRDEQTNNQSGWERFSRFSHSLLMCIMYIELHSFVVHITACFGKNDITEQKEEGK